MALTAAQTAAKAFLTTSTANYTSPIDQSVNTVSGWYTLGADNVVLELMNDLAFGVSLGLTAKVQSFNYVDIKDAIMGSTDFAAMQAAPGVLSALQWAISESPIPRKLLVQAGNQIMGSTYPAAKAAVIALLTADASPWQDASDATDAPDFSQADLNAIRAS